MHHIYKYVFGSGLQVAVGWYQKLAPETG